MVRIVAPNPFYFLAVCQAALDRDARRGAAGDLQHLQHPSTFVSLCAIMIVSAYSFNLLVSLMPILSGTCSGVVFRNVGGEVVVVVQQVVQSPPSLSALHSEQTTLWTQRPSLTLVILADVCLMRTWHSININTFYIEN